MQKLYNTTGHENDDLINQIIKNSGDYIPPVLFGLANLLYKQGDTEKAIFWFNAARLRSIFDARLCTDESARSAVPALLQQMPKDLIKRQYDDPIQLKTTIDRVIKWDETTPYNYDHRWISLHGIGAISSGLTPTKPAGPLTVPRESWDTVAQKNREEYRAGINQALTALAKQSSASMTSPPN
jgi:tetratricopeptide (TPR) repeat protein